MKRALIVLATVLALGSSLKATPILIGTPGSTPQDYVPFGYGVQAQFIYSAVYFAGPVYILGLTFFNTDITADPNMYDPATYTFKLSTTTASIASPSSSFSTNLGGDWKTFTYVSLAGAVPTGPSFTPEASGACPTCGGGTPFYYDPANGNLLLEIDNPGGTNPLSSSIDYNDGFAVTRIFSTDNSGFGAIDLNYGPVTELTVEAAPEPATLTLTGLGLLALVRTAVHKRRDRLGQS